MAEHIEHSLHDNGIHEITFLNAERHAVDAYMSLMDSLVTEMLENDSIGKLRLMVDLTKSHDLPSFSYITSKGRKLLHDHLKDRAKFHVRAGFVAKHDEIMVMSLAENFLKLMPVDMKVKVFEADMRDEAIIWILADE
jgi:hypothetical protein